MHTLNPKIINRVADVSCTRSCILLLELTEPDSVSMFEALDALSLYHVESITRLEAMTAVIGVSKPDLLILSVDVLSRAHLDLLLSLQIDRPIPILVFAQAECTNEVEAIVAAGINSYVVANLASDRLPMIIDLAVARFTQMQSVRVELEETKRKLVERKLIEKAKGIVMRQKNCSEEQAYIELRTSAMNQAKPMVELAQTIISAFDQNSE